MKAFLFGPTNSFKAKFDANSAADLPASFKEFADTNPVAPYDYIEFDGRSWTVLAGSDGPYLEEGRRSKPARQAQLTEQIPVLTTPAFPGQGIVETRGIVCGEAIMGANFLRDIAASITDVVGGRSGSYEKKLREARIVAIDEMREEALSLGANAVIGVDIDYETVGQSMLMVSASGTAVVTRAIDPEP